MTGRRIRAGGMVLLFVTMLLACSACDQLPSGQNLDGNGATYAPGRIKLLISRDGAYRLTSAELAATGLEPDISLGYDTLQLTDGENKVPFLIEDNALIFYGQASDNRYYAERPYILEIGKPGRKMAQKTVAGKTFPHLATVTRSLRLEENNNYVSEARDEDGGDVWFWSKLAQQETFNTEFTLPNAAEGEALLQLNAWGFTHNPQVENDHDLDILVNDLAAGRVTWDGQTAHTAAVSIPQNAIKPGDNRITLDNRAEGASFLDIVQVNWLEIAYPAAPVAEDGTLQFTADTGYVSLQGFSDSPIVLDITDPEQPVQIQGGQYQDQILQLAVEDGIQYAVIGPEGFLTPAVEPVLASSWHNSERQADLLIVTASGFAPALAPLVAAREAEGLAVALVPVNEIYDEFGYGAPSPESIRSFVRYTYQEWQPPHPRYLLLVGDASSDYLGHLEQPDDNLIPSPMVAVQFSGETVSDSQMADVNGDNLPDLAVGRWPVRTRQQAADLVRRTLDYEDGSASSRAIFATDSSEESFSIMAGRLVEEGNLKRENVEQRDGPTAAEIGDLWGEGAWMATYIGHGSIDRWGKDNIFDLSELDKLKSDSTPIVLQLTCLTGLFSHPEQESLAEGMLLHPHGPVLIIAASSLTLSAHQEPFAAELLRQLQDTTIQRIGDAFLGAKQTLDVEGSSGFREISDTFALFGDPSATITRP